MTTIKLRKKTKKKLDTLKRKNESYDATVDRLMKEQVLEQALVEGYKASAKEDRKIAKEWEGTLSDGL